MKQRLPVVVAVLAIAAAACKQDHHESAASGSAPAGSAATADPWAKTTAPAGSAATAPAPGSAAPAAGSAAPACPPPTTVPTPAVATAKLAKPFFFRATKHGMAEVWLFGTIHMGVAPDAVPDVVLAKLDKAERFAMEADITDASVLQSVMRNDGKSLEQDLGPDDWKRFSCLVGDALAQNLQHMKPSMAATVLEVQGLPTTVALDMFLMMRARKNHQQVVFLEAAAKQLALLDKWMDAGVLKEGLDHIDETRRKNVDLMDAYVAGDEARAIEMAKDDSDFVSAGHSHADFEKMMKELLLDRNAAWIEKIEDLGKKGPSFVAVGAMHLIGPGSVIERLEKKGWTVERVAP
jgi:uncharacterized protein